MPRIDFHVEFLVLCFTVEGNREELQDHLSLPRRTACFIPALRPGHRAFLVVANPCGTTDCEPLWRSATKVLERSVLLCRESLRRDGLRVPVARRSGRLQTFLFLLGVPGLLVAVASLVGLGASGRVCLARPGLALGRSFLFSLFPCFLLCKHR